MLFLILYQTHNKDNLMIIEETILIYKNKNIPDLILDYKAQLAIRLWYKARMLGLDTSEVLSLDIPKLYAKVDTSVDSQVMAYTHHALIIQYTSCFLIQILDKLAYLSYKEMKELYNKCNTSFIYNVPPLPEELSVTRDVKGIKLDLTFYPDHLVVNRGGILGDYKLRLYYPHFTHILQGVTYNSKAYLTENHVSKD